MIANAKIMDMLESHQGSDKYLSLIGEDLSGLQISNFDLSYVLFRDCNLRGTVFSDCTFYNADFAGASVDENTQFSECTIDSPTMVSLWHVANARPVEFSCNCFDNEYYYFGTFALPLKIDGEFLGYKLAKTASGTLVLVTLRIPADAKHVVFAGQKCRANKAEVVSITDLYGTPLPDDAVAFSCIYAGAKSVYIKGATVLADSFDPRLSVKCTNGIHFFLTKEEVIDFANRMRV